MRSDWFWKRLSMFGALILLGTLIGVARGGHSEASAAKMALNTTVVSRKAYGKPSDEQLRRTLTPRQYEVTQRASTEPPFRNEFWNNHQPGLYVDVATGEPLFGSFDKFDSGTGWPSFTQPVEPGRVEERRDGLLGFSRTEVVSKGGASHLGHVFDDGPPPTRLRYCINSASLRFVPADNLQAAGYGEYRALFAPPPTPTSPSTSTSAPAQAAAQAPAQPGTQAQPPRSAQPQREVAILAGGCFWGMEDILRKIPGVISTEAGYSGGAKKGATYEDVHSGSTGHAEAVRIVFDPSKVTYSDLLEKWFFRMHDPTTRNRQGNDVGTQYRSAIFATSGEQRKTAEAVKARVAKSGKWKDPLVTEVADAGVFVRAEEYHQKYLEKNPGGYTCHFLRN